MGFKELKEFAGKDPGKSQGRPVPDNRGFPHGSNSSERPLAEGGLVPARSGQRADFGPSPDTWIWNDELQRFYYTPALGELQDPQEAQGILPSAKSLQFDWGDLTGQYAGWRFPGLGAAYLATCGHYKVIGCLEHSPGYGKLVKHNCARAECPVCYRTWILKATEAIVERIEAGRPYASAKAIHVTVSPPRPSSLEFATKKTYLKLRRKAQTIAKRAGFYGGCCIFHPYRENKATKLWRRSPHFHLLGYGWIKGVATLHERTGWIVKNHRIRKSVGGTAYYQLSHAGVKVGHHVVTWFGSLSWKALRLPRSRPTPETCPTCGAPLKPLIWLGIGDNPLSDPETREEASLDVASWTYWHR